MKSPTKALVVGSMTALVGILSPAAVFANGTCYAVTEFDSVMSVDGESPLIVRYLTTNAGRINSNAETKAFGHLKQQAYSLVGKGTALFFGGQPCLQEGACTQTNQTEQVRIMTTVDGTIITGKEDRKYPSLDAEGAHMGLDVQFLRFDALGHPSVGPITLECTSDEAKTTPKEWICNVKFEEQVTGEEEVKEFAQTLVVTLVKVDKPADVEACSVFQDGSGALPIGGLPTTTTTLSPTTTTTLSPTTTTTLSPPTTTTLPTTTTTTLPPTTTTTLPPTTTTTTTTLPTTTTTTLPDEDPPL